MAIDLTKLEKKFIDLFANVTQEEFEQWLLTKTKPMAQQTLKMQQEQHITDIIRCFKLDPCASDYDKNYNRTEEYLWELIEKDGSVLRGIIRAMEKHLKK